MAFVVEASVGVSVTGVPENSGACSSAEQADKIKAIVIAQLPKRELYKCFMSLPR